MSATNTGQIYQTALVCEEYLRQLLALSSKMDENDSRHLKNIFQQFELWSGYLGVFAHQNISLDARLELAPDVKEFVLRLLDILKGDTICVLTSAREGRKDTTPPTITELARIALDGIEQTIDRLQRLAKSIRRLSVENLELRAQNFALKRQTGRNAKEHDADRLFERTATLFIRGLYPRMIISLEQQLLSSISYRRLRFLWQRRHRAKLEEKRKDSPQTFEAEVHIHIPDERPAVTQSAQPAPIAEPQRSKPEAETMSTTILSETPKQVTISPVFHGEQRAPTTVSFDLGNYPYPKAPEMSEDSTFCNCYWCGDLLERDRLEEPQFWRLHFKKDLKPYSCISEQCSESPVYFTSFRAWRKHMDTLHGCDWPQTIHKPRVWFCDIEDGEYSEFESAGSLWEHLSDAHPQTQFNESQKSSKLRRNILTITRPPNICPICNEDILSLNILPNSGNDLATNKVVSPAESTKRKKHVSFAPSVNDYGSDSSCAEDTAVSDDGVMTTAIATKIARHIGDHLKSLAFLSIRHLDAANDEEETSHSGKTAQAASGILSGEDDDDKQQFSGTLSSFSDRSLERRSSPPSVQYDSDELKALDTPQAPTVFVPMRHDVKLPCHIIGRSRNVEFADKSEQILELMDQKLLPLENRSTVEDKLQVTNISVTTAKAFLIWGKRDMGKTEIALEYAYSRKDKFEAIFWVDGSTVTKLNEGFRLIAESLGLLQEDGAGHSAKEVRKIVKKWLANSTRQNWVEQPAGDQGPLANWLIVFDDVLDETVLKKFWPPSGSYYPSSHGAVVITSQKPLAKSMFPGLASGINLRYKINVSHHMRIEGYDMEAYTRGYETEELWNKNEFFQLW